jgi:hypothetical protein
MLESNINVVSEKLIHVDDEITNLVDQQLKETAAKNKAAQAKLGLAVTNLNLASNANNALIENMLTLASKPDAAPGVFGMLGF